MSPIAPAVFVFEKSPRWEAELKRRLTDGSVRVRPCRSAADVLAFCGDAPGSVAVLDLAAGPAEVLQLLDALLALRLPVRPVVIGSADCAELEWPVRELGATDYVTDRVGGAALAQICRRLGASLPSFAAASLLGPSGGRDDFPDPNACRRFG